MNDANNKKTSIDSSNYFGPPTNIMKKYNFSDGKSYLNMPVIEENDHDL